MLLKISFTSAECNSIEFFAINCLKKIFRTNNKVHLPHLLPNQSIIITKCTREYLLSCFLVFLCLFLKNCQRGMYY